MMVTIVLLYMFVILCMFYFNGGANTNSETCAESAAITLEKTNKFQIAQKALENLIFEWGGPGGGPGGPGGGPGGPGGPGFGAPGPGYGPYYGGGYMGPYGPGGYVGPYGGWIGGPGSGGYGQYNPYYGPNGYGPTGNSAAGYGSTPKAPGRPEKYGFFQRVAAFLEHWFR